MRFIDLTGMTFGRWRVLARAPSRGIRTMWRCRCECGVRREVESHQLRTGHSLSCGCLMLDVMRGRVSPTLSHGMSNTPTYRSWSSMRGRASNPNHHAWHHYGGRGIRVCKRWENGGLPSRRLLVCGEHARRVDDEGTLVRAVRL
jgi:hypothetical protein